MAELRLQICKFVDDYQPGWVECKFSDVDNREWTIIEKVPVVTTKDLDENSVYPQQATIACEILSNSIDTEGRQQFEITTERPWGIESTEGNTVFVVFGEALVT